MKRTKGGGKEARGDLLTHLELVVAQIEHRDLWKPFLERSVAERWKYSEREAGEIEQGVSVNLGLVYNRLNLVDQNASPVLVRYRK